MPGFTPFTNNYSDLSDGHGYQFEFRCDICGSGYRSEFQRSALGTAGTLLSGASSLFGGMFGGASNATNTINDVADRGARDDALKKAATELMPKFKQCPRDHLWVDDRCWNEQAGLCVNDAPKLAAEMEAERVAVELAQMREKMATQAVFGGDVSTRTTQCTNCGKPIASERFCSNCGTPVGLAKCKSCGSDLAAGMKFCGNCGAPAG